MNWLPSVEHIMRLHEKITAASGGSAGVREIGLIESAIARGQASFAGIDMYPDIIEKAAAIGCGLTQNHGFVDGNKRIGMATALLILRRNGIQLSYTQEELIDLGLSAAQGSVGVTETIDWLRTHLR